MDMNNTLYCSSDGTDQVFKVPLSNGSRSIKDAAGNGIRGAQPQMLNSPNGIFVDIKLSLYVADCGNNRIQRFQFGQDKGITIPVNGTTGIIPLRCPNGITQDADCYLFVTDHSNHRIVGQGPTEFRCLVGCSEQTSVPSQLQSPRSLAFDSDGNIFVSDMDGGRIQQFLLTTNSCGK